jgi:hypothetical protein
MGHVHRSDAEAGHLFQEKKWFNEIVLMISCIEQVRNAVGFSALIVVLSYTVSTANSGRLLFFLSLLLNSKELSEIMITELLHFITYKAPTICSNYVCTFGRPIIKLAGPRLMDACAS